MKHVNQNALTIRVTEDLVTWGVKSEKKKNLKTCIKLSTDTDIGGPWRFSQAGFIRFLLCFIFYFIFTACGQEARLQMKNI